MLDYCKQTDPDLFYDISSLTSGETVLYTLINRCKSSDMSHMFDTFVYTRKEGNKNFSMLFGYLRMVELLLLFTHGQRSGDGN